MPADLRSREEVWSDLCFEARLLILPNGPFPTSVFEESPSEVLEEGTSCLVSLQELVARGLAVVMCLLSYLHGADAAVRIASRENLRSLFRKGVKETADSSRNAIADSDSRNALLQAADATREFRSDGGNKFSGEVVCRQLAATVRVKISDVTDLELLRDALRVLLAYTWNRLGM